MRKLRCAGESLIRFVIAERSEIVIAHIIHRARPSPYREILLSFVALFPALKVAFVPADKISLLFLLRGGGFVRLFRQNANCFPAHAAPKPRI